MPVPDFRPEVLDEWDFREELEGEGVWLVGSEPQDGHPVGIGSEELPAEARPVHGVFHRRDGVVEGEVPAVLGVFLLAVEVEEELAEVVQSLGGGICEGILRNLDALRGDAAENLRAKPAAPQGKGPLLPAALLVRTAVD